MNLQWPWLLVTLLVVPLLAGAYVWQLRRRRRHAVRFSSLAVVRAAAPERPGWKRHAAVALVLASLAFLGLAAARPTAEVDVPVSQAAVILALDVSGSMCATDVDPNRLAAAQQAVRRFAEEQDSQTRLGLVVFSGFAQLAVPPTTDRDAVIAALEQLTTGRGTTIGSAILKSVDAISEIDPAVGPADPAPGTPPPPPRAPGTYAPEIVVLLTDGANTTGVTPRDAAKVAAERGVRVYPIGFGTATPTSMVCTAAQLGRTGDGRVGGYGAYGGGVGGRGYLTADEGTLQEVADTTGGRYFAAADADRLQSVLSELPRTVDVQRREVELTVVLVVAAVLALLGGLWAASRWTTFPD
ncbi:VWA domain-containing protein [Pseudonocardia sp.]|uniref:VWA domain-containing protein n=1 Tax=Pseudonocardia sp. TaxID=60912 RepID=UPI003D1436F9